MCVKLAGICVFRPLDWNAQMPAKRRAYAVTNQPATRLCYVVPRLLRKRHLPYYLLELPRSLRPLLSADDEQSSRTRQSQLCRVPCADVLVGLSNNRPLLPASDCSLCPTNSPHTPTLRGDTPPTAFGNCGGRPDPTPLLSLPYD